MERRYWLRRNMQQPKFRFHKLHEMQNREGMNETTDDSLHV